jgi:hypothetical protein
MGFREAINERPRTVAVVVVAILIAFGVLSYYLMSGGGASGGVGNPDKAFFSVDDGKTWFPDDVKNVPPYMKDGKEAVRAYVYKCPDGKEFVAWLERYTPSAKKAVEAINNKTGRGDILMPVDAMAPLEVKAPGKGKWINQAMQDAAIITTPKCPGGGSPQIVVP